MLCVLTVFAVKIKMNRKMRLEEAATILGISLDDVTLDSLKATYKKLSSALDAEKVILLLCRRYLL